MLTNKKHGAELALRFLLLAAVALSSGCTPAGPRALLKGIRLIQEGDYLSAVERLQAATKLLPENAHAWNYLGLAFHRASQPASAERAYRMALDLDRKLNAARFNLGCLYLEQTNMPGALRELTSYTLVESASPEGWFTLGTAQLRARQLPEAERSFKTVLALRENDPDALNSLGVVQTQQRRPLDGLACFNAVLAQNTNYSLALLNSAIVMHQYLNNRLAALQRYRQYLAQNPETEDDESVGGVVRLLEKEVTLSLRPATNVVQTSLAESSPMQTTSPDRVATEPPSSHRLEAQPAPAKPGLTNTFLATAVVKPSSHPTGRAPTVEVTRVASALEIKPAEDVPAHGRSVTEAPLSFREAFTSTPASESAKAPKRGFFQRLNPFAGRPPKTNATASMNPSRTSLPGDKSTDRNSISLSHERYSYLSPSKPASGNHRVAETDFARGVRAQRNGLNAQAVTEYEAAIESDPAYFEAYYNLALAASDLGELKGALKAYEYALALRPDSADARYNFALALKQANCPQDAVNELEKLVRSHPRDVRARLSLANLYAQRLNQPKRAREHYLKVLETEPRHPEAARIRYWLASNH